MATTSAPAKKITITDAHRARLGTLLSEFGTTRFRRSDLAEKLYPMTSPRSRPRADALAGAVIAEAAKKGLVQREGHQHWKRVARHRHTRSGRQLAELEREVALPIRSKVPSKWVSVDLETGQIWMGSTSGWTRISAETLSELKAMVAAA